MAAKCMEHIERGKIGGVIFQGSKRQIGRCNFFFFFLFDDDCCMMVLVVSAIICLL